MPPVANASPSPIVFATWSTNPAGEEDDRLAVPALERRGIRVVSHVWDAPKASWTDAALVVIRSTWDYYRKLSEFLEWVERVERESRLVNPAPLVRWNCHKSYLVELAKKGLPVVPTEWVRRGETRELAGILADHGWDDALVKPAVSAASEGIFRVTRASAPDEEGRFRTLVRSADALVQPMLKATASRGERSLIYFDGTFSHAVDYPSVLEVPARPARPFVPSTEERESAASVLDALPWVPTYARVDFMPGERGRWLLGELELIEPHLYLGSDGGAPERFADALVRRLRG